MAIPFKRAFGNPDLSNFNGILTVTHERVRMSNNSDKDMQRLSISLWAGILLVSLASSQGKAVSAGPESGSHLPSQCAADYLRAQAETDGAFLAARNVSTTMDPANMASILQYPADDVVIVKLKGAEIRTAFERSISLYPQSNSSFLQVSGFTIEFSPAGAPDARVLNVTVNGAPLDEKRIYTVAMPGSLGRGGMGYFKIWDKSKIDHVLAGVTLESVLKGKKYVATSPRWLQR